MVLLTTTPQILNHISSLSPALLSTLKAASSDPLPENEASPISHKTLVTLSQIIREKDNDNDDDEKRISVNDEIEGKKQDDNTGVPQSSHSFSARTKTTTLNSLLRNTKPYKPPPRPKPEPSPEYTALMNRLRAEQEAKTYRSFLTQQDPASSSSAYQFQGSNTSGEVPGEEDEDSISPSLVLNILISVIFCAIAAFYMTRWWSNDGIRVLFSLAVGIVVGIAEAVVYAGYLRNVKRQKLKERRRKEKKVVVGEFLGGKEGIEAWGGSVVFSSSANDDDATAAATAGRGDTVRILGEKEIIWGKGKHGGMRRRVREKWEKENLKDEVR